MGSKVEGKKSRPVWEGKIKGEGGRESQCKEKVIASPCKLSQASCRPTKREASGGKALNQPAQKSW